MLDPRNAPRNDPRSDQELIAAINAADDAGAAAFDALYLRYRDWVVALAVRTTGDRDLALDVMQETFLYLLRQFPGFTLTAQMKTFLYPVVRHLAIAARKKTARFFSDDNASEAAPATAPTSPDLGDLAVVLDALQPGHREVLILRFVDALSLQEIAQATGLPLGTVKSRLHNALETLRQNPRTKNYFLP